MYPIFSRSPSISSLHSLLMLLLVSVHFGKCTAAAANADEIHLRFHTQIVKQMQIFELVEDSVQCNVLLYARTWPETPAKEMTINRKHTPNGEGECERERKSETDSQQKLERKSNKMQFCMRRQIGKNSIPIPY